METKNTADIKSFNYLENGHVTYSLLDFLDTTKTLKAGNYLLEYIDEYQNSRLIVKHIEIQKIHFPLQYDFIPKFNAIFNSFFDKKIKQEINNLGYLHKLGILLHGKHGTAKTSIFNYYINKFIKENDAICFTFRNTVKINKLWDFIQDIRVIQDNPIIIFFDELDIFFNPRLLDNYENDFKLLLDGHLSIDNCLVFGCTNYFDKIPKTILERPSRIKHIFEVKGLENEKEIYEILNKSIGKIKKPAELKELAKESVGKTMDEIKDIIQNIVMNTYFEKTQEYKKIGF